MNKSEAFKELEEWADKNKRPLESIFVTKDQLMELSESMKGLDRMILDKMRKDND